MTMTGTSPDHGRGPQAMGPGRDGHDHDHDHGAAGHVHGPVGPWLGSSWVSLGSSSSSHHDPRTSMGTATATDTQRHAAVGWAALTD